MDHACFGGTAALLVTWTFSVLWHVRWVRRLSALESLTTMPAGSRVKCSVVIAAREEEARIERKIHHLFTQHKVEFELIVVDDRSTDGTGEILRGLAKEDSVIR